MSFRSYFNEAAQHDALEKWVNENNLEGKRIHLSNKNIVPYDKSQAIKQGHFRMNPKPFGLWYAFGSAWMRFVLYQYQKAITELIYEIGINPASVLSVKDDAHAKQLEKEFGVFKDFKKHGLFSDNPYDYHGGIRRITHIGANGEERVEERPYLLDWARMTKEYDGIELDPDNVSAYWAEEWVIPAGCIWNKKGIKNYQILAQYNPQTNLYE